MNNLTGNNLADKNLVDRVLSGDNQAFGMVIRNTEALVAQIVFKLIPNKEDRKDLVQDIYLKGFHKLSGFKFQSKLSTWIAQIAYNTCLSWLEKKQLVLPDHSNRNQETNEDALDQLHDRSREMMNMETESQLNRKELAGILHLAISKLPPVYETLLILYHQEDLSYDEIVQITGLPSGTLKSYLFRARKMLKENLLSKYKKEAL